MLLLTLLACAPCDGDDPRIVDQTGSWSEDQVASLREALDGWLAAVGEGRVCIDRVVVDDTADGESFTVGRSVVGVDAGQSYPNGQLYTGLCTLLDKEEGLEERAIEADPDNGERLFSAWCGWGPPDHGWVAAVDAACGQTQLGDLAYFFLDVVYPNTPPARVDGDLSATLLAPVTVPGLEAGDRYTYNWVQDGDALAFTLQGEDPWEIVRIDPLTGATTVLSERLNVDTGSTVLHGGPGGVVLTTADRAADTLRIEVVATGASYLLTDPDEVAVASSARGTVSEGWLYLAWAWFDTRALVAVELETGEVRRIDLPDTGISEQVFASDVNGVPGGFVVVVEAADVHSSGDVTSIMTYATIHYRYDLATDTFTELTQDLAHLSSAGVAGDQLLAGTLWGDAGSVLGAYDVDNDRLLVSDDVCVSDADRPFAATADHLWLRDWQGDDLVLTGISLIE